MTRSWRRMIGKPIGVVIAAATVAAIGAGMPGRTVSSQAPVRGLSWWTVDNGGTSLATGGGFRLAATAGQPDAGAASGGGYSLTGGFWAGAGLGRPDAPAGLACGARPDSVGWRIDLTWQDQADDETGYRVERSPDGGGLWAALRPDQPAGATAFADRGLAADTSFTYRVRAIRDGTVSAPSNVVTCATTPAPPAPMDLGCEAGLAEGAWFAQLRWRDLASDETAFHVERSENGGAWLPVEPAAGVNATDYRDAPLPPDAVFDYRLRAYRAGDDRHSAYSNVARCGTSPRPAAPTELVCRPMTQPDQNWSFELGWRDNAGDETGFDVERYSLPDEAWRVIGGAGRDATTFTHRDLPPGEFLRYRVRARRSDPYQVSDYSNVVECAARLPKLPIVLIPGAGGSILEACDDTAYIAPPMPELLDLFQVGFCFLDPWDDRCLLALKPVEFNYSAGERVWLGGWGVFSAIAEPLTAKDDRYFMAMRLDKDGIRAESDVLGTRPCLRVPAGKAGVLMKAPFDAADIYAGFVTFLNAQGYHETEHDDQPPNLYFFPYDFRRDLTDTAGKLDGVIDAALAATGAKQVDLIGHSMGGLVARNYLLDPAHGPAKVRQLITLGTPYLGAPKLAGALEIGDNLGIALELPSWLDTPFSILFDDALELNPAVTRAIVQNWPGTYELGPTRGYFKDPETGRGAGYIRLIGFKGPESVQDLDYAQSAAYLRAGHNDRAYATAEAFHDRGIGDLSKGLDSYIHHSIVSYRHLTPGHLVLFRTMLCTGSCQPYIIRSMEDTQCGDGTVPLVSALANNSLGVVARGGLHTVPYAEHMAMPQNHVVWSHIEHALRGWPQPDWPAPTATPDEKGRYKACSQYGVDLSPAPTPTPSGAAARQAGAGAPAQVPPVPRRRYEFDSATRLLLIGDGELHVFDRLGRHGGASTNRGGGATSTPGEPSPDVAFSQGEHGAVAILNPGVYTVTVRGNRPGANVQLRIGGIEGGNLGRSLNYPPLAITTTSAATLTLQVDGASLPPNPPALTFRYAPAAPAEQLLPVDLAADDTAPPDTILAVQAGRVQLTGQDEPGGSGVDRILYATAAEPDRLVPYTGPFPLPPGGIALAVAVDRAGNADDSPATWPPAASATATPSATPSAMPPQPTPSPPPPGPTPSPRPPGRPAYLPFARSSP